MHETNQGQLGLSVIATVRLCVMTYSAWLGRYTKLVCTVLAAAGLGVSPGTSGAYATLAVNVSCPCIHLFCIHMAMLLYKYHV